MKKFSLVVVLFVCNLVCLAKGKTREIGVELKKLSKLEVIESKCCIVYFNTLDFCTLRNMDAVTAERIAMAAYNKCEELSKPAPKVLSVN